MLVKWYTEEDIGYELVPLNFDASLDYHTYGINLTPDGYFDVYVDGEIKVHKQIGQIPRVRIFTNLYACNTSYSFCHDELKYTGPTALSLKWLKYCNEYKEDNCTYQVETPHDNPIPPYSTSKTRRKEWKSYYLLFFLLIPF